MSSVITTKPVPTDIFGKPIEQKYKNFLNHQRGILSWLTTLDHKRICILYMISVLSAFALGGIFAMLLRTELLLQGPTLATAAEKAAANFAPVWNRYNQFFTLHGAIMVFMFIIPGVPAVLGNFALPLMLGAKDVAFPRLNLMSWYCWVAGAIFFLVVLISGGLDTGWTFYTPYSTRTTTAATLAVAGVFALGFSSILTGINFIASIHMLRAKGMGWTRLPLFLWGLYATGIIQILATPVLAITLLLLLAERTLGVGIFDPKMGGDPVLFQHFFWFYSHPAVYVMILPAMGIISELIATFSRKHIFGYGFIAASSVSIAILGFLVWGHHMFTSGQSDMANVIFSLITFSVAVPSAIKIFNWLATMYKGSINLATPMLYALGFIWMFTIGGLTGVFLAALSVDIHLHDTYFIVAHFHYVMVGSMVFAFLGGMYYWWPKIFGRMYHEKLGQIAAVIIFLGFNITFFIQFVAGSQGMPRRYADYPDEFAIHHFISSLGSYVLGIGLLLVLINWIHSLARGKIAPANPWGSNSLEWHTVSPPPHENFRSEPPVQDPYDFSRWRYDPAIEGYVLDEATEPAEKQALHY